MATDDFARELQSLQIALSSLGLIAAANYCRTELAKVQSGEEADAELVAAIDRLIGDGLRMCDRLIAKAQATEIPEAA